jgi:hypothetical protein
MWILQFLPDWTFYLTLLAGIVGIVLTNTLFKLLPYSSAIKVISIFLIIFGIFMWGAISDNNAWLARVKDLEVKLAQAETKSAITNTEIVQKIITKTQLVRERGQDVVQYVDREVVKYDNTCVIPKEFIEAHNSAAKALK